jgi:hypothetical protein
MATVWIVTTGNSDARLLTNKDFLVLKDTSAKRDLLGSCYCNFQMNTVRASVSMK